MTWQRFKAACDACQISCDPAHLLGTYQDLCARYAEPQRAYHRVEHIDHCLRELDIARNEIPNPAAVELALWFHDAVYSPGASNNERESAELFRLLFEDHSSADLVGTVSRLILVTERGVEPSDLNEAFVCDIDMSSFGIDRLSFYRDSLNVRMEQSQLKDADYFRLHIQFLNSLLSSRAIFYTKFFQDRYETSARRNIADLIAEIQTLGGFRKE